MITSYWHVVYWSGKENHNAFKDYYFGLGWLLFPVNGLSKQKSAMRHIIKKPHKLKVRCYTTRMINLYEYFDDFPGAKASDNFVET